MSPFPAATELERLYSVFHALQQRFEEARHQGWTPESRQQLEALEGGDSRKDLRLRCHARRANATTRA